MDRIDMRSSITCLAILQIESIMQKLPPGDCIEVLCDDETLVEELRHIRKDFFCEQIHCKIQGDQAGIAFILRKQRNL